MAISLLVAEGNTTSVRARQIAAGKPTTAYAYIGVLCSLVPDATCTVVCPTDEGWSTPTLSDLKRYDGAIFTGSALHAYDDTLEVLQQIDLARTIFAAGIPFFGSCWGMQVAAVAAGGRVRRNPKGREIGFARDVQLTAAGIQHPMYRGKSRRFDAPAVHLDEIALLPPGASVLSGNSMSAIQAVEIRHDRGVFWGVQYHPEYAASDVAATLRRYGKILIDEGLFANEAAQVSFIADLERSDTPEAQCEFAKRHALDIAVFDPSSRLAELRNWLDVQVLGRAVDFERPFPH